MRRVTKRGWAAALVASKPFRRLDLARRYAMTYRAAQRSPELFEQLKDRIRAAQVRAALSVNRELVSLYWQIGTDILARQEVAGWGAKVIDRLASDLRREFPATKGFSSRNLKYMRAFAEAWPDQRIVQQAVAQIPWGHNVRILTTNRASV